jgi:hypothetical protein
MFADLVELPPSIENSEYGTVAGTNYTINRVYITYVKLDTDHLTLQIAIRSGTIYVSYATIEECRYALELLKTGKY